jgi:hypothetical protein
MPTKNISPNIFGRKQDEHGNGPAKIKEFITKLDTKVLKKVGTNWYASDGIPTDLLPEEVSKPEQHLEGSPRTISITRTSAVSMP